MSTVDELVQKCLKTKPCNRCFKDLPLFDFSKNKTAVDGLQNRCKKCDKEYQQTRRIKNKDYLLAYQRKYQAKRRKNFEYRLQMLLNASKQRAILKNREHSITLEDIKELYPIDGKCPVFGFDLEFNSEGFKETSPSIDRIDSSKGYTKDNIQIISWKANRLKSCATVEDLELLVAFLKQGE